MKALGMAGHLIRRLNRKSTHTFTRGIQDAGFDLTPVQFAALDAIASNPGIDQARVAANIAYDRATIGGVIDRLESKGLILRTISKQDRRARELRLSDTGESTYDQILPVVTGLQADILSGLDPQERKLFLDLARKLVGPIPDS